MHITPSVKGREIRMSAASRTQVKPHRKLESWNDVVTREFERTDLKMAVRIPGRSISEHEYCTAQGRLGATVQGDDMSGRGRDCLQIYREKMQRKSTGKASTSAHPGSGFTDQNEVRDRVCSVREDGGHDNGVGGPS
ncbi:hypothetical protein C8R44DRAFT_747037 [Mycena epipterygia]|nr:hypothetical protein C8R44DRAFT_747037 [Mycena epipterygia]